MANIALPRKMLLGPGTVGQLRTVLSGLGLERPLIVADPFYANNTEVMNKVTHGLRDYDVFSGVIPDPTTDSVQQCVNGLLKPSARRFDSIVALGGGSAMDTAKAAAVLAVHGGKMREYKAPRLFDEASLPLICIPTTAGTGSEVTKFTIVTDSETNEKMLCVGLAYLPVAAIVDYELTLTAGFRLTADSGIDAFCHAMEAYVSKRRNAFSDGLALSAITRIATSLRQACNNPLDRVAREAMMLASTEAGMAFSNSSVTLIHGMSRPIGALFHIPHGMSNAMLAPLVTSFSIPGAVSRYATVARAAHFAPLTGTSDEDAAAMLPIGLSNLCKDLKVPLISEFGKTGISPDTFARVVPKMALDALASGSPGNNPVVPTAGQIEGLYRDIFEGKQLSM